MQYAEIVVKQAGYITSDDIIEIFGKDVDVSMAGVYKVARVDDSGEAILIGIGSKAGYVTTINFPV